MSEKIKNVTLIGLVLALIFSFAIMAWVRTPDDYSYSERKQLAKFPTLSFKTISSGKFMSDFETYATDQFPTRENFRTLKAYSRLYLFNQSDNNDVYQNGKYISKIEYPLNYNSLDYADKRFKFIYDTYFKNAENSKVYLSLIPDKNKFLADKVGAPKIDYNEFKNYLANKTSEYARFIDIYDLLEIYDYYYTDTHWRQECIWDVADRILTTMGEQIDYNYTYSKLDNEFYGVYYGQYAMPMKGEEMYYAENESFKDMKITSYDAKGNLVEMDMYNMDYAHGRDPYEMYLSGSLSLITIENPNATSDRQLFLFRDSFGSSIAPYFSTAYSKVTIVDIRYMASPVIGAFVKDFNNADVLFLYSTLVLNNATTLK
jgi:hypothetical protein